MKKLEDYLVFADTFSKVKTVMEKHAGEIIRVSYSGNSDCDSVAWLLRYLGFNVKMVFDITFFRYNSPIYSHLNYMIGEGFDITLIPENTTQYAIRNNVGLLIYERRNKNRNSVNDSCYIKSEMFPYAEFFPIFWWTDEDKAIFDKTMEIRHAE